MKIAYDTLRGKFTLTRTEAALTPYGGLAAWSGFLKHLGIMEWPGTRRLGIPARDTCSNSS
jgi:hypothetical protein